MGNISNSVHLEGEYFQFSTFANGGKVVCMVNGGNVSLTLLLNLK
jgi:hypothetical protein